MLIYIYIYIYTHIHTHRQIRRPPATRAAAKNIWASCVQVVQVFADNLWALFLQVLQHFKQSVGTQTFSSHSPPATRATAIILLTYIYIYIYH